MPIYDIHCPHCGHYGELLVITSHASLNCPACGSKGVEKLISAPSSLSGASAAALPGPADHGCCGSRPQQADCAGPGSCCGKA